MRKVPDISTRDRRAVLGSPTTFPAGLTSRVELNRDKVSLRGAEQLLFRGCSWKIWGTDRPAHTEHTRSLSKALAALWLSVSGFNPCVAER